MPRPLDTPSDLKRLRRDRFVGMPFSMVDLARADPRTFASAFLLAQHILMTWFGESRTRFRLTANGVRMVMDEVNLSRARTKLSKAAQAIGTEVSRLANGRVEIDALEYLHSRGLALHLTESDISPSLSGPSPVAERGRTREERESKDTEERAEEAGLEDSSPTRRGDPNRYRGNGPHWQNIDLSDYDPANPLHKFAYRKRREHDERQKQSRGCQPNSAATLLKGLPAMDQEARDRLGLDKDKLTPAEVHQIEQSILEAQER